MTILRNEVLQNSVQLRRHELSVPTPWGEAPPIFPGAPSVRHTAWMEWMAPVSTATGAVIGVGSVLLAERMRWRRELHIRGVDARRELYASFLVAYDATFRSLEAVERGTYLPDLPRAEAAEAARAAHHLNSIRQQIRIVAPVPVVQATDGLYEELKHGCVLLGAGMGRDALEVIDAVDSIGRQAAKLRLAMRRDLECT